MSLCKPVIARILKKGVLRVKKRMILLIVDQEVPQECRKLNTMLFNFRIERGYSCPSFIRVGYVKNILLMLGSALNPIVSIGPGLIKQSYEQIVTMGFKMQWELGWSKMHTDWVVKSSYFHPSPVLHDK